MVILIQTQKSLMDMYKADISTRESTYSCEQGFQP